MRGTGSFEAPRGLGIDRREGQLGVTAVKPVLEVEEGEHDQQQREGEGAVLHDGRGNSLHLREQAGEQGLGMAVRRRPSSGAGAASVRVARMRAGGVAGAGRGPSDVYTTDVDVFNAGVRTVVLLPPEHRSARQRALHRLLSRCGASSVALEEFAKIATGVRVDSTGTGTGQSRSPSAPVTTANGPDLLFGLSGNENVRPYTEASGWTALPEATAACGGATGNLTNTPATGSSRRPAATPTRRRSPWPSSGPSGSSPTSAADRARGSSRRALWSAGLPSAILPAACRG